MSRLRIRERVARKTRAAVMLQCRDLFEVFTDMWFVYNMAFVYAMARLALDDTPTSIARRDVTAFFSPQDCVNFLRFTQSQVRVHIYGKELCRCWLFHAMCCLLWLWCVPKTPKQRVSTCGGSREDSCSGNVEPCVVLETCALQLLHKQHILIFGSVWCSRDAGNADAGSAVDPRVHPNRLWVCGKRTGGSVRAPVPARLPMSPEGYALSFRDERIAYLRSLQLDVAFSRL